MKQKLIFAAVAFALSGAAAAQTLVTSPGSCNGASGCQNSPTTNQPGSNPSNTNTNAFVPVNSNTQGQQQGQAQGQLQGQQQGQGQGQGQAQIGINRNANTNNNDLSNRNANVQGQSSVNVNDNKAISGSNSASLSGAKASNDGNAQAVSIVTNNPGEIRYSGGYDIKSAPSVVLGGPASGPCNGASGGLGLSVMGGGGAFNFSKVDEGCEERETARMLHMIGKTAEADALLKSGDVWQRHLKRQQDQAAAKKAEAAPAATPVRAAAAPAPVQTAGIRQPTTCVSDEFIARRMGATVCK